MAKKSKIVKNAQRREIVGRYAKRRAALKEIIGSPRSSPDERSEAQRAPWYDVTPPSPGSA
jgi:small subunit ribosomal protein S14